ncbi:hypothetical protein ACFX15_024980 [Malus domestica]
MLGRAGGEKVGMVFGYGFIGVSGQLVINEIDASTATPLQAIKLIALYLSRPDFKESAISNPPSTHLISPSPLSFSLAITATTAGCRENGGIREEGGEKGGRCRL